MSSEKHLITTLGNYAHAEVGWMLAHEHVFANFAADDDHSIDPAAVVARMLPELACAKGVGIHAMVDATAIGAARRPDILAALSQAADFPILVATGWFKEPAKRDWALAHSDSALCAWLMNELTIGIDDTDVQAGWIKMSVTDSGVQPHEARLISAAAGASRETDAVVGCHTVGGTLAHAVLDMFEAGGGDPARFIWVHTQTEPDINVHLDFARRGAWIEYDAIDQDPADAVYLDWIVQVLDAGLGNHLLLSQDRVGYDPAHPTGGVFKPYSALTEIFIPKLRERGVDAVGVDMLLHDNPFRAYAR